MIPDRFVLGREFELEPAKLKPFGPFELESEPPPTEFAQKFTYEAGKGGYESLCAEFIVEANEKRVRRFGRASAPIYHGPPVTIERNRNFCDLTPLSGGSETRAGSFIFA